MGPALDRERLCKLLGLLSSDFAGERSEAGRAADRLVREAGLRWPDVILPALLLPDEPEMTSRDAFAACDFILDFLDTGLLTSWEIEFARGVGRKAASGGWISDKQRVVLARLVAKCQRHAARAA